MAIMLTYLALVGVGETLVVLLGLYLDSFTPLYSVVISMLLFCGVLWVGFPLASRLVGDD
jgi:hypothetical protein